MRIFITGGTGFIGAPVVKELKREDNTLLILSRQSRNASSSGPEVDIVPGDLSDIDRWWGEVEQFGPETAVHMAWESLPDYSASTSKKNLIYGLNLITMLAEAGCKSVICTGSCWEYGQQSGKVDEDTEPNPFNAFSAAKNSLHWLGAQIAGEYDMHFIWTRLFYVYGPGQRETSLVPYLTGCVRRGEKPDIKTPSAGNDFIYVEDVARAISAIANKQPGTGAYNIGSGYLTRVQQIMEIVYNKLNVPCEVGATDSPTDGSAAGFWADISRIGRDTGWKPQTGIKEGIEKTIDYYLGT